MLKYYIKVIIRNLLKIFWIFPIDKKKIYFQSFGGKSMNCNPWYIFKYMYEKYPDYKYVWLLNHEPEERLKGVTYVKKNTFKWVKEILTSKVLVCNCGLPSYLPYSKWAVIMETWHGGGAYKKIGKVNKNSNENSIYYNERLNYYISSSKKFTEIMSFSTNIDLKKFMAYGMPRNDIFFDKTLIQTTNCKVRNQYHYHNDDIIVLYAPTYRGLAQNSRFDNELDVIQLKDSLREKYHRNVKVIIRGHHSLKKDIKQDSFDKNVSSYPNMQELLCMADILITDYSSVMWDYSFLYRPCFLFVPDFEEYVTNRGFYTDPYSWGFPICKTNDDLIKAIKNFDEQTFIDAMKKHHNDLDSYENGTATEKVVTLLKDNLAV